jgi:hypothetical protein
MAGGGFAHKDADGREINVGDRVYDTSDSTRTVGTVIGFFGGVLNIEWQNASGARHRARSSMRTPDEVRKV